VLGHQLITEGICDILVSWTYPNSWAAGQGVLFHSPESLGLKVVEYRDGRAWVSLCHLVWVLQPQRCCDPWTRAVGVRGRAEIGSRRSICDFKMTMACRM
ncbi:unnamed protein product, partial [Effrenium voratum]